MFSFPSYDSMTLSPGSSGGLAEAEAEAPGRRIAARPATEARRVLAFWKVSFLKGL